jgi:hypothetical protein
MGEIICIGWSKEYIYFGKCSAVDLLWVQIWNK